jgi:glycosyltransferase involved in cell wall biosynthesis
VKVIFLNRFYAPDISATSQLLTDLARSLAASGWDVRIVTSRQRYDHPGAGLPKEETIEGVRVHRVASTRFGRAAIAGRTLDSLTFCVAAAVRLMRLARAGDIVVAMTDPPLVSVVAAWVARRRGAMLVNWLQDVFPEVAERLGVSLARGVAGRMARRLRDYSLRSSRANVVLSESMEAAVRAATGDAPSRGPALRVIHNWADGALVRPLAREANPMRREWGLQDAFVVGYSGNIGRVHEFDTLLDAAERLRDVGGLAIAISGGGNQSQRLRDEVDRRGIAHLFRFHGYQPRERLRESLCVADAHLVTLRPELEGLVVPSKFYGIAAAGRCVLYVGDPQGELARTITRAECGIAIAVGDAQGLAGAIRRLLGDPAMTRRMGENARNLFDARFDRPRAMSAWVQVLTTLHTKPDAFDGNRQRS